MRWIWHALRTLWDAFLMLTFVLVWLLAFAYFVNVFFGC